MNKVKEKILKQLIHSPNQSFNELWGKEGESNKFAYHLKSLEEDNFLHKVGNRYELTHDGKKFVAYVDGDSGKKPSFPLIGVIVAVCDNDKFLMLQRTKEPFFGYWGLIGGKMKFSQYILETAADELLQETGLVCDLQFKGLFSSKTFNNDSLSYNHQLFVVKAVNPKGSLLPSTREGVNKWFSFDEIKSLRTFPNILKTLEIVRGDGFGWLEADRIQKDDVFVGMNVLRNKFL